jgi:hypothetical protein
LFCFVGFVFFGTTSALLEELMFCACDPSERMGLWRDAREFGHGNGIEATLNYMLETGGSANYHTCIDGDFYSDP